MQIQPAGQEGRARLWRVFTGMHETREHRYRTWRTPGGKVAVHGHGTVYVSEVDGRLACTCLTGAGCIHREIARRHLEAGDD